MQYSEHRPEGPPGRSDRYLWKIGKELNRKLIAMFRKLERPALRLPARQRQELAGVLVEFAEDIHCNIGMWRSLEDYNQQFFGTRLPFLGEPGDVAAAGIDRHRIQHLLWGMYLILNPDMVLSPTHPDLSRLSEWVAAFLNDRFVSMPRDSGVANFLAGPTQFGWDIKRKLVWMGRHSYLFRNLFRGYIEGSGGDEGISETDDFVCQQTTAWSGLGVVDILAGSLDIMAQQREDLRGWYERHMACYKVLSVHGPLVEVLNIISDTPYTVRVGEDHAPRFHEIGYFLGSLVPWNGEWYVSGNQRVWPRMSDESQAKLKDGFLTKTPAVAYRYCKDLARKAAQSTRQRFEEFVALHGGDLAVYPDGLSLAADWQKRGPISSASRPEKEVKEVMEKSGLKNPCPNLSLSDDLLRSDNGVAVLFRPDLGMEIVPGYCDIARGMEKRGHDLEADERLALREMIMAETVSPEFVNRLVREHGADSILSALLLLRNCSYALDFMLRRHKGSDFRNRYPTLAFV